MSVAINDFVLRQIKGSGKTYSPTLSFEQIAQHADERMTKGKYYDGYREGVRIVKASKIISSHFICPFVPINEDSKLEAKVVKRKENEDPYVQFRALTGEPIKTDKVDLICYRHDVLSENNEHTTFEEWELISIQAIPDEVDVMPMGPVTMMRNQLELIGGTKGYYDSDSWAKSVQFWQKYAALKEF